MKFTIAIVLLVLLSTMESRLECPEVFAKPFGSPKVAIGTVDALYPNDQKTNLEAASNALKQTKSARALFYKPHEKLLALLKIVATNLENLFKNKEFKGNIFEFIISEEQRQSSNAGEMQEPYFFKSIASSLKSDLKLESILELIQRVKKDNPSGDAILSLLGFIGDLAGCIQDTFGGKKFSPNQQALASIFEKYVDNLKAVSEEFYNKYSPDKYYTKDSVQSKLAETMYCFSSTEKKIDPADKKEKDKNIASHGKPGVMGTGKDADSNLNQRNQHLINIVIPKKTIPKKLNEFCPKEPWAGHFSGNLYEQILLLQIFASGPNKGKWDAKKDIDKEKKEIIGAMAASFLIGTGIHSAIEVAVPLKNYLGDSIPAIDLVDATKNSALKQKICGEGKGNSSTDYVIELFSKCSKLPKSSMKKYLK